MGHRNKSLQSLRKNDLISSDKILRENHAAKGTLKAVPLLLGPEREREGGREGGYRCVSI